MPPSSNTTFSFIQPSTVIRDTTVIDKNTRENMKTPKTGIKPSTTVAIGDESKEETDGFTLVERRRKSPRATENRFGEERPAKMQTLGKTPKPNKPHDVKETPVNKPMKGLKGASFERSQSLYLENIQMDDNDTDDDIIALVKEHAKRKGIKLMQAYVIHNRFSMYRVGVRMTVPVSSADKAVEDDSWPAPIKCRQWQRFRQNANYGDNIPSRITYRSRRYQHDNNLIDRPSWERDDEKTDNDYFKDDNMYHRNMCDATREYVREKFGNNLGATGSYADW
ncbi:unnamed protein product [Owenia fusiformis]|uniref:Uncharacterized protein n=1 Tax=Owenia fusiformis TaxID=6347 RepID=A0A8S4P1S5_OWEFU|nr:unnamed protein product [Owenia fusiformis]